jgi:hypothetical protein
MIAQSVKNVVFFVKWRIILLVHCPQMERLFGIYSEIYKYFFLLLMSFIWALIVFLPLLILYNAGAFSQMKGKIVVCKEVKELYSRQEGVHVHCDDYNIEDSESPSNASHDIQYLWF